MLENAVPSLLQRVRRLAATTASDEQLLADFLARRSDEAFAALLGRHGPMVLNVCRRILHDAHAAEDVFQATFLVLADRAAAVRRRASLAGFLHGVAYRLAVRARRRRLQTLPGAVCDRAVQPADDLAWKEMLGILDEELALLSESHRAPLVLCYLEGRTQDEAARQLGWGVNTLRRRLARGRRLLEARLRGRGVTLPAALAGVLAASAFVPGRLQAATLAAVGARGAGGLAGPAVALSPARKPSALLLSAAAGKIGGAVALAAVAWFASVLATPVPPSPRLPASPSSAGQDSPGRQTADPLPSRAAFRLGTARYRHGTRIDSLAVSADGRLAATRSRWGMLGPARVFDLADGRCLCTLPRAPGSDNEAVGLSPDGKLLAAKDDRYLYFYDAATGKEIRKIKYVPDTGGSRANTHWLTFTPDGKQLAVTLMGAAVRLLDVDTGAEQRAFAHDGATLACVFSPDGKLMATGGYSRQNRLCCAQLWEVSSGKELRRFTAGDWPISALAFAPDGATLAGGCQGDGRLRLWEVASGKELRAFPRIGRDVRGVAFAPDGKTLAAAGDAIHFYDPVTGKERLWIGRRALGIAFNRDGSVLTGAVGGVICQWDAASGRPLTPSVGQDSAVEQILVGAGRRLFTVDQEGDLHAWDVTGRKAPRRIVGGVERGVVASRDGRWLAWAVPGKYGGTRIRLYDVAADSFIDRFPSVAEEASVEAFLPDGKTILTLDRGATTVRLWDVVSGKERRSFPAYTEKETVNRIPGRPYLNRRAALSPDGKTLAIADMDSRRPVCLWDVTTGKFARELDLRMTSVTAAAERSHPVSMGGLVGRRRLIGYVSSGNGLAFSPDGRFLVTWSEDPFASGEADHLAVWDAKTGQVVRPLLSGRQGGAGSAAFAPDGRTLATASRDGRIRLWEVATWKVRAEYRGHRDRVTALAFGLDGRLFTGGLDTVVLGW